MKESKNDDKYVHRLLHHNFEEVHQQKGLELQFVNFQNSFLLFVNNCNKITFYIKIKKIKNLVLTSKCSI